TRQPPSTLKTCSPYFYLFICLFQHINIGTRGHQIYMRHTIFVCVCVCVGCDTARVSRPKQVVFLGSHDPFPSRDSNGSMFIDLVNYYLLFQS
ncbi:unnamed protein product, partial [Schistosoma intercalatum]